MEFWWEGTAAEVAALSPQAWTGRGGTARVLIASLEYVGTNYDEFIARLLLACVRRFDRLILDECHEAVLLNGGHTMHVLLSLRDLARHVWCVSGTPFPEGDRSVFGLHQLLGVHVNFVLTNSPFLGGMAAGIGVLGSNVGGAGSVEGFDVEERVGPWPIKAAEHDVWAVLQARTGARHELLEVAATARPLGVDSQYFEYLTTRTF